ncbi:MAG: nucleoside-diphosphate kinase [Patescibacteria group bacterium]
MVERTLVLIKPDAIRQKFHNLIINRILGCCFELVVAKRISASAGLIEDHYKFVFAKSPALRHSVLKYLTSGPIIALVLEGENIIANTRVFIGPLGGEERGTIRGDFPSDRLHSLVHGSDSELAAEYEISVWFPELAQKEGVRPMKKYGELKSAEQHFVVATACQLNGRKLHAQAEAQKCLSALVGVDKLEDAASGHVVEFGNRQICLPDFLHVDSALSRFRAIGINI